VAMESTGVYWKPIYAIMEGALEIVVANAQHIKKVPGRRTDAKDPEWIADLLCHGLLCSSFVPPRPIRELRDLMRYRRKLAESQAAERKRRLKYWRPPTSSWQMWPRTCSECPACPAD
jgi:transposase